MKRKMLSVCFLISLFAGMMVLMSAKAETPVIYNAEDTFEHSEHAMVYIRILHKDNTVKAVGSGVILTPEGIAATAYHVIKEAERIEGILYDGRTVGPIEVLNYDELTDIAVLKLPDPTTNLGDKRDYEIIPVRETAVKYGEKVFAMGYPIANTPIITEGIINSPKAMVNGRNRILISAQVASGMSGGPILDQQGNLAGIISGSMRTMNNIHLVIDMAALRSVLPTH
ncbi:Serine endoprotease DegS [compost metagenome]